MSKTASFETATVDDVAEVLRSAKRSKTPATLLLGAGCSVSAGIPAAIDMTRKLKRKFPKQLAGVADGDYQGCVRSLPQLEVREFLRACVGKSRLNATYLAVAELIRHGFVDRVLTTNFDTVVERACATAGIYPAVYDLPSQVKLTQSHLNLLPSPAIFHLHGQHSAWLQLHEQKDIVANTKRLRPLVAERAKSHPWVIVGWSGGDTALLEAIANQHPFDAKLFWVAYMKDDPPADVRLCLLSKRGAYNVPGFNSDSFAVALATRLECFPPILFHQPFSYLKAIVKQIAPFPTNAMSAVADDATYSLRPVLARVQIESPQKTFSPADLIVPMIDKAIQDHETPDDLMRWKAAFYHHTAHWDGMIGLDGKLSDALAREPDTLHALTFAYAGKSREYLEQAGSQNGESKGRRLASLLQKAYEHAVKAWEARGYPIVAVSVAQVLHLQVQVMNSRRTSRIREAMSWLQKGISGAPEDEAYAVMAGTIEVPLSHFASGTLREEVLRSGVEHLKLAAKLGDVDARLQRALASGLLDQLEVSPACEHPFLLQQAQSAAEEAETMEPDQAHYLLACIAARRNETEKAQRHLLAAEQHGTCQAAAHMRTDPDLASVRECEWFVDLVERKAQAEGNDT